MPASANVPDSPPRAAGARRRRPIVLAMLLGLAATLAVLAMHLCGLDERAELQSLDLRFRHLSTAPLNDRILHIDIDDRSLEELGRWPWPRAQIAGLTQALSDAGAEAVALDIIMPEPQPTRFVSEAADFYSADQGRLLGELSPLPVFDDQALAEAIATAGRVFLPMHVSLLPYPRVYEKRAPATMPAADAPYLDRQQAIDELVGRALHLDPRMPFQEVLAEALPGISAETRAEDFDFARRAYLRCRALASLERFGFFASSGGYPDRDGLITPPLVTLARACYGSGFVTVDPDEDGVVRRIPLLVRSGERLYPQFALAIAADALAREHGACSISPSAKAVRLTGADGFRRDVPVDRDGYLLINWLPPQAEPPRHIAAVYVGAVAQQRASLERNLRLRRRVSLSLLEMGRDVPESLKDAYFRFANELAPRAVELHEKVTAGQVKRQGRQLYDPAAAADDGLEKLLAEEREVDAQIDQIYASFREALKDEAVLSAFLGGAGEADAAARLADARFLLGRLDLLDRQDEQIRRDLEAQLAELRGLVAGKLCLIGSTATGAADFVPTPVDKRSPGVVVHANILNTILSGAFVRPAGRAAGVAAILIMGLLVAAIAATRPVLLAVPLTAVAMAAYAGGAAAMFRLAGVWMPLVAPLAAGAAALLTVTAYRQLTEERAKRHIRGLFAHALSPALVDRLMEDPSLARLGGERRELTCVFSDLQGFTPLAERLGEEGTVRLLNRYFDRMTEVIQNRRGGYLNKFLGDGLFVFFGAPVLQADHAARALQAAVDCQAEVAELNRQLALELGGAVQLTCRAGLATGPVMVGNCGSSQRMDYTAIGDAVNLASRLESANKFFGTRVLVAEETWRQGAGDDARPLLARPLGAIRVVGKDEAVRVWHVAGPAEAADEATRAAYADFATAVTMLDARRFSEAVAAFERLTSALPGDKPARILLEHARACQASPPPADQPVTLRLAEK